MVESLELLEQVSKESCFNDTPFFLFLNKKDLFEELIRVNDISCLFSEYSGDKSTQDQLNFISEQFQQRMPNSKKMASVNFIAARMKRDVRHAFEDVKQYLIDYNQKKISKAVKSIEKIN